MLLNLFFQGANSFLAARDEFEKKRRTSGFQYFNSTLLLKSRALFLFCHYILWQNPLFLPNGECFFPGTTMLGIPIGRVFFGHVCATVRFAKRIIINKLHSKQWASIFAQKIDRIFFFSFWRPLFLVFNITSLAFSQYAWNKKKSTELLLSPLGYFQAKLNL